MTDLDPRLVLAVGFALDQLPELVTRLEVDLVQATAEPGGASGKPSSRPPVNLAVVSDIAETWNGLTTWTRVWCEDFDLHGPERWTWTTVSRWLAAHWPRAVDTHDAAADFAHDLLHRHWPECTPTCTVGWVVALRGHDASGVRTWRRIPGRWACPVSTDDGDCGGRLLEHASERVIRCDRCDARWVGEAEYEQLGRLLGCTPVVTIDQAALLYRVNRATIYRWMAEAGLRSVPLLTGEPGVDKRDLAYVVSRRVAVDITANGA